MSELLDIHEAARYVGDVSTRTLYREVKRGKLRIVKVGGSTRFRRTELDRYLRASERVGWGPSRTTDLPNGGGTPRD